MIEPTGDELRVHARELFRLRDWPARRAAMSQDVDRVKIGGLMRCCLQTLDNFYPNGPAKIATEGQRLRCEYARDDSDHGWMIFRAGSWEWDHE